MNFEVIFYVLLIDFLAIMSPGPDFFMILKNSLIEFKAGFYTALGIATGGTIVFSLCIFGLGEIIINNKTIFEILKILGALYLIYLAFKSILAKNEVREPGQISNDHFLLKNALSKYFLMGLTCNLTNPKSFMFCIALATYIAEHGKIFIDGPVIIGGSLISVVCWFTIVARIFGSRRIRKLFYARQRIINIAFALVLLYVASKIVTF